MTEQPPEAGQLPVTVQTTFAQTGPNEWTGVATCPHGDARSVTYVATPDGIDPTSMTESLYRHHHLLIGCECIDDLPKEVANVTFDPAPRVEPSHQRIIPQTSARLTGPSFYYPPLTADRFGTFSVDAMLQLDKSTQQGARGRMLVLVNGAPLLSSDLADEAGHATARLFGQITLRPNETVVVAYDNTGNSPQDVMLTSLTVGEIWAP